jgi:hypothetical protein
MLPTTPFDLGCLLDFAQQKAPLKNEEQNKEGGRGAKGKRVTAKTFKIWKVL